MKKLLSIALISLGITSITNTVQADQYYSSGSSGQHDGGYTTSSVSNNGGYSSSASTSPGNNYPHPREPRHHERNKLSIYVNIPSPAPGYVVHQSNMYIASDHHHRHHSSQLDWTFATSGNVIPEDAVLGGVEAGGYEDLFICRANYRGGMYPGKIVQGNCNIAWGGREIILEEYETLISPYPLRWVSGNGGYLPRHAIEGGYEHGRPLFICQAQFNRGIHPGRVVGRECNISWGGREIAVSRYNVLVR